MTPAQTVKQAIRSDLPDAGIESKAVRRAVILAAAVADRVAAPEVVRDLVTEEKEIQQGDAWRETEGARSRVVREIRKTVGACGSEVLDQGHHVSAVRIAQVVDLVSDTVVGIGQRAELDFLARASARL